MFLDVVSPRPTPPAMVLTTFSASIVSLTLPTEPLDTRAVFVAAAFLIYGFEDRFQDPADFKPLPQLALSIFERLNPAQKFAVAAVLEQEAEMMANRNWGTFAWEQYACQRTSTAWRCGWDIACLLMHWYLEDRLPPARTNQSLQLEYEYAAFIDKVGYISTPIEDAGLKLSRV